MSKSKLQIKSKIQMIQGSVGVWVLGIMVVLVIIAGGWVVLTREDEVAEIDSEGEELPAAPDAEEDGRESLGVKLPSFSLKNYEGEMVSLADFSGRPLVINSWATRCPFCVEELDDFAKAQQALGDEVVIMAIDRAESLATAKGFTDELGVTDELVFLLDPTDSFFTSMGGFVMPETVFVRADGTIKTHKRGPMKVDEILERARSLID